jgi:hypothetical protein
VAAGPVAGRLAVGFFVVPAVAAVLFLAAAAFWTHDALPYLLDYTESTYSRFWPDRIPLLLHIAGGTIAMFAGPLQLWTGLRGLVPRLHRWTGYAYAGGVVLAAGPSFYLAFHSRPDFGFSLFILAVFWILSVAMALLAVRNDRIVAHREWVIRSYILTFAFVSYRYLVGVSLFKFLGESRVPIVLWMSWVIPMMVFEFVMQWRRVTAEPRSTVANRSTPTAASF